MRENGDYLAFIVGHYKSGSTWLANLLSLHPAIRGLSETHIIRYATTSPNLETCTRRLFTTVAWADGGWKRLARRRLGKLARPFRRAGQATLSAEERPNTLHDLSILDQFRLKRMLRSCSDADSYCRTFFEFLNDRLRPGRYLLEKTPTNVPFIPRIRQLFPECKMLCIYRDGRDVVVSDRFHLARVYHKEQDLTESILKWKKAMEAQLEFADSHDVFSLSYESLLADGHEMTRRILARLELPEEPGRVEDMVHRSSFEFVAGRDKGKEDHSQFYRKGVSGDWLNHFTDAQKELFSALAGDMLVKLGYESDADWRSWGRSLNVSASS